MRLIFIICCYLYFTSVSAQDYNILSFGAKPDCITLNTSTIQTAIDEAHSHGGGMVTIPEGTFLTGSIVMRSGVNLHLVKGAILLGSTDPAHYIKLTRWYSLVIADSQSNISITGQGTIDGQGRKLALHIDSLFYAGKIDSSLYNFVEMRPSYLIRPQLIEFVNCKNIQVRDVTLKNAACWVQTHDRSEHIIIDNVRTESDAYWNNDGIDIVDCKKVRITNCFVNASDDGICIKSQSPDFYCDSIYVGNCTVRSSASAVKFGTVSHGGFKNVTIENIKVYDTFRSAIAIECVDGGFLENILVQNIEAVNTGNAIFIKLGDRSRTRPPGTLKNVMIRNIKVDVAFERPDYAYEIRGPALPFFHNTFPSSITGIPGQRVENITLENIEINYPGRGNDGLANMPISRLSEVPEKADAYPEFSMFGELPAWGLYVRHVDGLVMKNFNLSCMEYDYRPPIVIDDLSNLILQNWNVYGEVKSNLIILNNTENINIANSKGVLKM